MMSSSVSLASVSLASVSLASVSLAAFLILSTASLTWAQGELSELRTQYKTLLEY